MKHCYLILLAIVLFPIAGKTQNSYYITNNSLKVNAVIIDDGDKNNSQGCKVKTLGGKVFVYSPKEIKEYVIGNRRYISKKITINGLDKMVFLEQLLEGKNSLYYYHGGKDETYYIEKEDFLLIAVPWWDPIDRNHYKNTLKQIMFDCYNVTDQINITFFNKKSMRRLVMKYNECKSELHSTFKWGVSAGYELMKIKPTMDFSDNLFFRTDEQLNKFNYSYKGALLIGGFVDLPISQSDFAFHISPYLTKHEFSYLLMEKNHDSEMLVTLLALKLPVLFKYNIPFLPSQTFLMGGGIIAYNLKNDLNGYNTYIDNNVYSISQWPEEYIIPKLQGGFSFGGGFSVPVKDRSILIKIAYDYLYGKKERSVFQSSSISISTSIIF